MPVSEFLDGVVADRPHTEAGVYVCIRPDGERADLPDWANPNKAEWFSTRSARIRIFPHHVDPKAK